MANRKRETTRRKSSTTTSRRGAGSSSRSATRSGSRSGSSRSASPARSSSTRSTSRSTARSAATASAEAAAHDRHRPTVPEPVEPELPLLVSASDHYAREKARRADRRAKRDPLEEARLAFQAMLAKEAEAQRGGRPKGSKTRAAPKPPTEDEGEAEE